MGKFWALHLDWIDILKNVRGLTVASWNICSVVRKLDDLKLLLEKSSIDILCLNETFLNDSILNLELQINGYNFIRLDRNPNSGKQGGGGLLIYYKSNRNVNLIQNSHLCTPDVELCWIELSLPNSRPTYICPVYRAPDGSNLKFLECLDSSLSNPNLTLNSDQIVLGDFNIDLASIIPG